MILSKDCALRWSRRIVATILLAAFLLGVPGQVGLDAQRLFSQDAKATGAAELPPKTFVGIVVDAQGQPIVNATVLLHDQTAFDTESPADFCVLTNDDGRFEIKIVPDADQQKRLFFSYKIWAFKNGYSLRCVATQYRDEIRMVLPDEESVSFQITHPSIESFDDVVATPYYFDVPNGCYTSDIGTGLSAPIPLTMRRMIAGEVLPSGQGVIRGVTSALLNSVLLESPRLGKQYGPVPGTIKLRETGSLTLSLSTPPEFVPETCQVYVTIDDDFERPGGYRSGVHFKGFLDENHQIQIPTIGSGPATISLTWPDESEWIALTPSKFEISPGENNDLQIGMIRGVEVHGRVFASDTGQPVSRSHIALRSETINCWRTATSDLAGRFSVRMPPGDTRVQLFAMPLTVTHQYPETQTIDVPQQVAKYEMDPILIDPKGSLRGFLIDEQGKRVPGRRIAVLSTRYRHLCGISVTDARGSFLLHLSNHDLEQLKNLLEHRQDGPQTARQNIKLTVLPQDAPTDTFLIRDYIKTSSQESTYKIVSKQPLVLKLLSESQEKPENSPIDR
ncbi:carboxypeptidase-like regulatory domain-containing protein [Stieleria varia]|uniref:Nickel uptake substrate-specific transmembrane region n=1 Tax=Stieleria varia TaxID=2528005 RepID=A0A5C6ATY8_9BACT|nr:carboxypeptidase-like regulatory domain-containing protein [Stieleria varia]TWU02669.1 hypothetical protein Pla52n_37260 [Stieleria varia]